MQQVQFSTLPCMKGYKIGVINLTNPSALNALTLTMLQGITHQLQEWLDDPLIVAVFLHTENDKAFCAGGDVKAMYATASEPDALSQLTQYFETEYRCDYLLHRYPKPIVVWANGITMGGGVGLFMGASHRIVTPETRLAMPEITIGLYPDVGATWFLNRLPSGLGLFLGMTGAVLNATDCIDIQFAQACFNNADKHALLAELQNQSWAAEISDYQRIDDLLVSFMPATLPEAQLLPYFARIQSACCAKNLSECIENLNAIPDADAWLNQARNNLRQGSLITAHVCFRQLRGYHTLSLEDAFRLELGLSVQSVLKGDFIEGVRARLIDKTQSPQWRFGQIENVDMQLIDALFEPPWQQNPLHNLGGIPGRYV
ncbi:enoyl-CoA hydratase/isomerase family protein [Thaumasiovibrio sp. DFM-14]|uniref:enoyl-CoA hydratase/isomerase family protein n=1 Tax=Thaumasiovibrio sp. DFM-14 TaxID=3384792 RepID=UPI00399F9BC2